MTEVRLAKPGEEVVSRRTMKYCGMDLDRGQVFKLKGVVNDEQLGRLGYSVLSPGGMEKKECRYCDAVFVDLNTLNAHGARTHERKPIMPPLDPRTPKETDVEYQNRLEAYNEELSGIEVGATAMAAAPAE